MAGCSDGRVSAGAVSLGSESDLLPAGRGTRPASWSWACVGVQPGAPELVRDEQQDQHADADHHPTDRADDHGAQDVAPPRGTIISGSLESHGAVVHLRGAVALIGRFPALAGVDLEVARGEIVLLRGANGAGKTSLLRACAGLLPIVEGEATVLGHDLRHDRVAVRAPRRAARASHRPVRRPLGARQRALLDPGGAGRPTRMPTPPWRGSASTVDCADVAVAALVGWSTPARVLRDRARPTARAVVARRTPRRPRPGHPRRGRPSRAGGGGRRCHRGGRLPRARSGRSARRVARCRSPEAMSVLRDAVLRRRARTCRSSGGRGSASTRCCPSPSCCSCSSRSRSTPTAACWPVPRPGCSGSPRCCAGCWRCSAPFALEATDGVTDALRLSGLDPGGLFLGKAAAVWLQMLVLEALLLVGVAVLYDASPSGWPLLVVTCLVATTGIAAAGTLYGVLAAGARVRETLLPLLLLPVLAPVLIAATRAFEAGVRRAFGRGLVLGRFAGRLRPRLHRCGALRLRSPLGGIVTAPIGSRRRGGTPATCSARSRL